MHINRRFPDTLEMVQDCNHNTNEFESIAQTIHKKIVLRRIAQLNKGEVKMESDRVSTFENTSLNQEFISTIHEAYSYQSLSAYRALVSNRKGIGKLIVFGKRVIRKLIHVFFGWYINPLLEQQSVYNGKIVNAVSIINSIQSSNDEMLRLLREQIDFVKESTNRNETQIDIIKEISLQIDDLKEKSKQISDIKEAMNQSDIQVEYIKARLGFPKDLSLLNFAPPIDYMDFENQFRGTREHVKKIQEVYLDYFQVDNTKGRILDIGCGRGEFLELMWENSIPAYGIDLYQPFVDFCRNRGFTVLKEDALTHLSNLDNASLNGIFIAHVMEHLDSVYLRALIEVAYKKLKPNCYLLLETPNPESLLALMFFHSDIEHTKPIPFRTLQYFFAKAGFSQINRFHSSDTIWLDKMEELRLKDPNVVENIVEFNRGIETANSLLFSSGDYTLIAKK